MAQRKDAKSVAAPDSDADACSPVELVHGDCRDVMPVLPAGSFDGCITDPPYGIRMAEWDREVPGCAPQKLGPRARTRRSFPGFVERSPHGRHLPAMLVEILKAMLDALRSFVQSRADLLAENIVLRQQIIVLQRSVPKPSIRARDRIVLALAARLFSSALKAVTIVRPETVVRWHRSLWRLIWRRKSQRPVGRPPADADLRTLIRRFWKENPLWGENRIAAELGKLGYNVSPRTVAKYRPPHCLATVANAGPRLFATISIKPGRAIT